MSATSRPIFQSKGAMNFQKLALAGVLGLTTPLWAQEIPNFQVRPGFKVTLAAKDFGQARLIEVGENGTLFVSQPQSGTISTLKKGADGVYKKIGTFTEHKPTVHGMHWKNGWLWFAQSGTIWRARDTDGDGKNDEEIKVLDGLVSGGGHWWRTILVGDNGFYTSIGDAGNINDHTGDDRQKVWFYSLDGQNKTMWAGGLRNTEKLSFRPGTQEVWGADHGSDNFGKELGENGGNQPVTDKVPPCEFNRYDKDAFYGHPFIIATGVPRPEFRDHKDILEIAAKTTAPQWNLGAHWAPNGWTWAATDVLGFKGDALVACHGSWNSSKKVGYRVERVMIDSTTGKAMGAQGVVLTLGEDGKQLGRPVDCAEENDGSILFSDDQNQKIWRISKK